MSAPGTQLPLYVPSSEEVADPQLFAANVRACMVSWLDLHQEPALAGFNGAQAEGLPCSQLKTVGLKPSRSTLAEKREFHSLLSGETPAVVKKTS